MFDLRGGFAIASAVAGMAAHDSPLMDTAEAAAYIDRTENFVRRFLRYEVPVVQRGPRGPLRFFKSDLDRWLANNTKAPVR